MFLESNPNGQFIWMQHDLGTPFSAHVADLLTAVGPFHCGDVTQVGY